MESQGAAAEAAIPTMATMAATMEETKPSSPSPSSSAEAATPAPAPATDSNQRQQQHQQTPTKPIHSLVLDAGPLIRNEPPAGALLAQAHELWTVPAVARGEVRDAAARARMATALTPFLRVREPRPASARAVRDFARRTGDLPVLSATDVALLALAYELECERNGGDWRLRSTPGQKGLNGPAPGRAAAGVGAGEGESSPPQEGEEGRSTAVGGEEEETPLPETRSRAEPAIRQEEISDQLGSLGLEEHSPDAHDTTPEEPAHPAEIVEGPSVPEDEQSTEVDEVQIEEEDDDDDDDDGEGWITPSNLKKHQERDQAAQRQQRQQPPTQRLMQVALLTTDFAMQNVLLRMNLNLVTGSSSGSSGLARITRVKTWVLRCHGCFQVTRDTARQFCPRCGQPTLTRVSASTDQATGAFTLHLKRNFQWNNRGNVYSVPKPVHGSANGKLPRPGGGGGGGGGGGKGKGGVGGRNGWGRELILAEDQKEYVKKTDEQRRMTASMERRDLMDEDYLPRILSGDRKGAGGGGGGGGGGGAGRIKVGAGRNVNSKKRR